VGAPSAPDRERGDLATRAVRGEDSRMLTRDMLTDVEWRAIRNTPHHVIIALSASGGGALEDMRERNAGLQAVVDAMHSTHPLLREIAVSTQIMAAQDEVRMWVMTIPDADRTPAMLHAKALESMQRALATLSERGGPHDRLQYGDFVIATATRVARAAGGGGLLATGGPLVSFREQEFIARLGALVPLPSG
jgi:hypothetical protein